MIDLNLERRAVACTHWRWMPGMLAIAYDDQAWRCVDHRAREDVDDVGQVWANASGSCDMVFGSLLTQRLTPDLTEPATVGCLLALVRAAWGDPYLTVDICGVEDHRVWACYSCDLIAHAYGDTEAAALVAALEAAP